jgi:HEAT repeat protein
MKLYYPRILKPIFLTQTLTVLMLLFLVSKGNGSNNLSTAFPVYLKSPACLVTDLSPTKAIQSNDKTYRVQVCASRFILPDINLLEKQCGQSNLTYEEVDGYFKYTTPSTFNYAAVLKTLHEIKAKPGFEGSFVVAYKGSERVKPPVSKQVVVAATKDPPHSVAVDTPVAKVKNQIAITDISPIVNSAPKSNATKKLSKEPIESPVYFKAGFTNSFNIPNLVIIILILFSFGFLVLGLLLIFKVFRKIEKSEESEEIGELYAEQLAVYLKDKSENVLVPELFKEAITDFEKDILISEIITLYSMLPVETGNKIRDLYFKLELDYYSFQKLSNEKWNVQAMGIHELSAMEVNNEVDSIGEFINHSHPVPRHEAIAASVKLRSDDPFGFLDRLRVPLTKRDQINAYTILWKQQYAIPDFSRWFDSTNPSVVQFAVEMASMNRQIEAVDRFDKLLHHSYEEVRESVIKAIGDLFLTVYSTRLIAQFDNEHEHLRILILQTMGKLQDPELLNFLSDIVLLNPFMKIRMEAAKALINIGPQGLTRMQTLLLKEDHDITYIYNYIIQS